MTITVRVWLVLMGASACGWTALVVTVTNIVR
jgi:hypothetical protein